VRLHHQLRKRRHKWCHNRRWVKFSSHLQASHGQGSNGMICPATTEMTMTWTVGLPTMFGSE